MKHLRTRWAVLLISIIFLSSCGGSKSSTPTSLTPEGTAAVPITLIPNTLNPPSSIHAGQVGNTTSGNKSYYQLTGLSVGTYTITLYGLSADADLLVYNGLPFDSFRPDQTNQFTSNGGCTSRNGGTTPEQCTVTVAAGGTMNIEVDGEFALSGATYSISVNKTPYTTTATACDSITNPGCINFDAGIPSQFVLTQTGTPTPISWANDCTSNAINVCSIHSDPLSDSQTNCFSYTTSTTSPNNPYVSFNLKVSSASTPYYDRLLFYIDNVLQTPVWSGNASTQGVMFNTVSGTHTYQWCHSFNNPTNAIGVTSGDVWVDDIIIQ